MRKDIMNIVEVTRASHNINSIETALGHELPTGVVDYTSLGDHILDIGETTRIAHNIKSIEIARNASNRPRTWFDDLLLKLLVVAFFLFAVLPMVLSLLNII